MTPSGQIELSARPFAGKRGTFNLRPSEQGACRGATTRPWWTRSPVVIPVWSFVTLHAMSGQTMATHHKPVKVLHRLVAPFRSNPFLQSSASPCRIGLATCFSPAPSLSEFEPKLAAEDSYRPAMLELRTAHRGPFAHHWLELESLVGKMTVGFGPATCHSSMRDRSRCRIVTGMSKGSRVCIHCRCWPCLRSTTATHELRERAA